MSKSVILSAGWGEVNKSDSRKRCAHSARFPVRSLFPQTAPGKRDEGSRKKCVNSVSRINRVMGIVGAKETARRASRYNDYRINAGLHPFPAARAQACFRCSLSSAPRLDVHFPFSARPVAAPALNRDTIAAVPPREAILYASSARAVVDVSGCCLRGSQFLPKHIERPTFSARRRLLTTWLLAASRRSGAGRPIRKSRRATRGRASGRRRPPTPKFP